MSDQQSTRKGCPVTAQRIRDIAGVVDDCDAGDLLATADWLDEKPSPEASAASEQEESSK